MSRTRLASLAAAALLVASRAASLGAQDVTKPMTTTTLAARPPAPTNVRATKTGTSEVTVTWDPVAGATAYQLGRLVSPNGWVRIYQYTGTTPRWVDQNQDLSVKHQYRVVAVAGAAASLPALSNEVLPGDAVATAPALRTADPSTGTTDVGTGTSTTAPSSSVPQRCVQSGAYYTCITDPVAFSPVIEMVKTVAATCPLPGQIATGGGFAGRLNNMDIHQSMPMLADAKTRAGWVVTVTPISIPSMDPVTVLAQAAGSIQRVLQVWVICTAAGAAPTTSQ